jgi:hypothetical protein
VSERAKFLLLASENTVLRRIIDPMGDKTTRGWKNCVLYSYICYVFYCNVDGQSVSRQRPVNNLQSRKRTQQ